MSKSQQQTKTQLPPTHDETEVLRRMLHTPPTHHKAKPAPEKKRAAKKKDATKEKT